MRPKDQRRKSHADTQSMQPMDQRNGFVAFSFGGFAENTLMLLLLFFSFESSKSRFKCIRLAQAASTFFARIHLKEFSRKPEILQVYCLPPSRIYLADICLRLKYIYVTWECVPSTYGIRFLVLFTFRSRSYLSITHSALLSIFWLIQ